MDRGAAVAEAAVAAIFSGRLFAVAVADRAVAADSVAVVASLAREVADHLPCLSPRDR
jgi:hypothetical protein